MARCARVDVGDHVFHVLNRAIGRLRIFETPADYQLFLHLLAEAKEMTGVRVLSFTVMPNHWHLHLYPRHDGDMGEFMHWLTNAHTRRVHAFTQTTGAGPLYQGRYKSFLIQDDRHLLTVLKYIERNPVRAKLCKKVEDWPWGSAWIRAHGTQKQKQLLAELPVPFPRDYRIWVNTPDKEDDLQIIRGSVAKSAPFGQSGWVEQMVMMHKLEATMRGRGRPKGGNITTHV